MPIVLAKSAAHAACVHASSRHVRDCVSCAGTAWTLHLIVWRPGMMELKFIKLVHRALWKALRQSCTFVARSSTVWRSDRSSAMAFSFVCLTPTQSVKSDLPDILPSQLAILTMSQTCLGTSDLILHHYGVWKQGLHRSNDLTWWKSNVADLRRIHSLE